MALIKNDFSVSLSNRLKYINYVLSSTNSDSDYYHIVWILIGSRTDSANKENCHEYPPIIEELYNHPEKYILSCNRTKQNKLYQYVIRIDPLYNDNKPIFPNMSKFQDTISPDWKIKTDCSHTDISNICITHMNDRITNENYVMMIHSLNMLNTFHGKRIIGGIMNFTGIIVSPIEDLPHMWIGPNNCMAKVHDPLYFPIINLDCNNDMSWEMIGKTTEDIYNIMVNSHGFRYKDYNNQLNYIFSYLKWILVDQELSSHLEILKVARLNDTMPYLNRQPEYLKNTTFYSASIAHLLWRLEGNEFILMCKKIVDHWEKDKKFQKLEDYVLYRLNEIRSIFRKMIYIPNVSGNTKSNGINVCDYIDFKEQLNKMS